MPSPPETLIRRLVGRPSDWHLSVPPMNVPRPGLNWIGPLTLVTSVLASWFAFRGATGDGGSVAFGLYIGAVSILLMAWSFVLAVRIRVLEPFFGGLDSMYRVHRWAGTLAVVAMFLHTSIEPEIEGGIRGASRSLANTAEDLAGTGQTMLYILIGISLIRWFPYRWWRLTHKLLGIPFVFACFHFITAMKPYANNSGWGWWFGGFMLAGTLAYLQRVLVRDVADRGLAHTVTEANVSGSTLELVLQPETKKLQHNAGQFAFIKVQGHGLSEPHAFTIASSPDDDHLRFFIRNLGDWTARMHDAELVGQRVLVEGPYGRFDPFGHGNKPTVWVAGGVGITPFLSATNQLAARPEGERPVLFYCVRTVEDAMALDVLERAQRQGRLDLVICSSADGTRFSDLTLRNRFGAAGLVGAHVAACGPVGLLHTVRGAARDLGASDVEIEDFDIRQGFGPDLSTDISGLIESLGRDRVGSAN